MGAFCWCPAPPAAALMATFCGAGWLMPAPKLQAQMLPVFISTVAAFAPLHA